MEEWNLPAQYEPFKPHPVRQSTVYHLKDEHPGSVDALCGRVAMLPTMGWRAGRGLFIRRDGRRFPKDLCKRCAKKVAASNDG
jgi:hypothetical protein|tara:strand:+ start:3565 stop:3813 length:249 start_codon:yes stop_codon:yes gene_type:complete